MPGCSVPGSIAWYIQGSVYVLNDLSSDFRQELGKKGIMIKEMFFVSYKKQCEGLGEETN